MTDGNGEVDGLATGAEDEEVEDGSGVAGDVGDPVVAQPASKTMQVSPSTCNFI